MLLLNAIGLVALMIGFGSALAGVSGLPAGLWAALLAIAILLILRRESLDATVASVLVIGGVNIAVLIAISVVGLVHFDAANLAAPTAILLPTPRSSGSSSGPRSWRTSATPRRATRRRSCCDGIPAAAPCSSATSRRCRRHRPLCPDRRRDPRRRPGRSSHRLRRDRPTPLAVVAGPIVAVLGSVFVILAMGLSSLHISLGLYNQVGEWLPIPRTAAARRRQSLAKALPVVLLLVLLELLLVGGGGRSPGR